MSGYLVPSGRLESRFSDKYPPLSKTEAAFEADRCLYCYDAPCIKSCPTAIDIPTFIRKIATGNLRGSARTILEQNLLGASCARVCPVEVLCESTCVFVEQDRAAIPIGRLQRHAMERASDPDLFDRDPPTGHRVALVGAGPASLACAGRLALRGHEAILYERNALPGGLNATGVAPYKLRLENALQEVEFITALGVEIRTGITIGQDITAEDLLRDHDAVFLGPGLGDDTMLSVLGHEAAGVIGATCWVRSMKTDPSTAIQGVETALVVGGGNTAIDVARELRGLGVRSVAMSYRRERSAMSAYHHELSVGLDEGIVVHENTVVTAFEVADGELRATELTRTPSGTPTLKDTKKIPTDLVVIAIGQAKLRSLVAQFEAVACDPSGRIVVDPTTFVTGNPRVFAGGDAVNGGKEVVNAVHEGQVAAQSIDTLLRTGGQHA